MDNLENGYTEELDFSNIQEEMNRIKEEVKSVPLEPVYEEVSEPLISETEKVDATFNENPNAKVVLNKAEEEVEEQISHKDIKIDFKGNKTLMRVLMLGGILLLAILVLPYIAIK